ncbi:uncharacterized protein LOC119301461 isoform X2 [Triticum dicoccoides]|uniref:uncharacterized protein LOC119301461 isoform X2 n=1 Tax=Triticum dicoccoides TaxID=85692 RepID=UPI0018900D06|nr:uncharacterized protein LOC119301461 isoform X2 [Triticum dicoccoides]
MSRPPAAAQPNQPMNAATPTPRPNPAPIAFAGPFQPPGVPRPAPYPAPFYQTRRPLVFPPVLPPGTFHGPRVYQPPPQPPGGFGPHPGTPLNPFGLPGFHPSHTYHPVSVLSHQRPAVIDGAFGPGAVTRPPITPVPPANVFGPGAMTRPRPLMTPVPAANVFGPGAVTRPPIAFVPPANVFGPGAMARPPIALVPPANVFGPGAVTRPPIAPLPSANVFGPGAVTRPPIAPLPPANVFGHGAVTTPPIAPVPPANVLGHGAVTRPPMTPVPPATDFGPGAVTRPHIAPVPPVNEPQFKVYVGKIASTVDNDFVLSLLQVCGIVKSWDPVTNPIGGTPTGFGFCDFESAEGSLRAWRLLNKLRIDGQELLVNVNEATSQHLQKYCENTTEEKANETDMAAMQTIHSMVEERMRCKFLGSPIQSVQASTSISDEKGDGHTRSGALEERTSKRQREKEEHLGENKVVCLQGWKDKEVISAGKPSLQIDAISSTYVPMEPESTIEHERKRQRRENGFHKSNGEGKGIVSVPVLVSDKLNSSSPGEKVNSELQATSKSGNKETLDAEQLLAAIPKTKEELFAYDVNWAIYDKHGLHERMRHWVSEKSIEVFGEEIAEFVEYVVASTKEHVDAPRMLEALVSLMDDSAEKFILSLWTELIFEIKKAETGLA